MFSSMRRIVALLVAALTVSVSAASAARIVVARPPVRGVYQLAGADLVVSSTSQGDDSAGGYDTDAVIANQGNQAAGGFYVSNSGFYIPVVGVNPGVSTVVRFYRAGYCETSGTVMADAFNQVYELNEGNNARAWSIIS